MEKGVERRLKKPIGKAWAELVARWYGSDHDGKVDLAREFGTTEGSMRHWISDSGEAKKHRAPRMTVNVDEILGMKTAVNLDFVSFDIETSNLHADFSILLTAVIKPFGQEPIVFRADNYPEWKTERSNDKQITIDISTELRKHAIVITHYGQRFDIPFLRAKMVKHGLEPLPPMFGIDTWRIARNNFAVTSRRLANLVNFFDLGDKHAVEGTLWMKAAYEADKKSMDEIVEHNIIDCALLEKLACLSFPLTRSIPRL